MYHSGIRYEVAVVGVFGDCDPAIDALDMVVIRELGPDPGACLEVADLGFLFTFKVDRVADVNVVGVLVCLCDSGGLGKASTSVRMR